MPTSAGYERLGVVMTGGNNGVCRKIFVRLEGSNFDHQTCRWVRFACMW